MTLTKVVGKGPLHGLAIWTVYNLGLGSLKKKVVWPGSGRCMCAQKCNQMNTHPAHVLMPTQKRLLRH